MYQTMTVVALEEHYWDPEMVAAFSAAESKSPLSKLLIDVADERIRAMDEAGIDRQVLSHGAPGGQKLPADTCVGLVKRANDRLAEVCARRADRFAGFAALPTAQPEEAAKELERAVVQLGLKGAMIHGLTNGEFHDHAKYWPIYETAERLDVPLYLHPSMPLTSVRAAYYDDYAQEFPTVVGPAWGFTAETATQAIRLILSRLFERHPNLKIVLGHLGEGLPFLVWRINQALARPGQKPLAFHETFRRNFYLTTSGNFSTPALLCSIMEMGIDHILFSVDYPYVTNKDAIDWIATLQMASEDRAKLLGGNARRLLKL